MSEPCEYVVFYGEWFGTFRWDWYDSVASTPNVVATGIMLIMLLMFNPIFRRQNAIGSLHLLRNEMRA